MPIGSDATEEALLSDPLDWIPGIARQAEDFGRELLAEVGFGSESRRVSRQVVIELREPLRFPSRLVLPMTWRAADQQELFPVLDADIEVAPLGAQQTQLSVSARYQPPLGAVGRAIDRALLHRVAEAAVKDFVDRTGERIISLSRTGAGQRSDAGNTAVTP